MSNQNYNPPKESRKRYEKILHSFFLSSKNIFQICMNNLYRKFDRTTKEEWLIKYSTKHKNVKKKSSDVLRFSLGSKLESKSALYSSKSKRQSEFASPASTMASTQRILIE